MSDNLLELARGCPSWGLTLFGTDKYQYIEISLLTLESFPHSPVLGPGHLEGFGTWWRRKVSAVQARVALIDENASPQRDDQAEQEVTGPGAGDGGGKSLKDGGTYLIFDPRMVGQGTHRQVLYHRTLVKVGLVHVSFSFFFRCSSVLQ